MKTIQYLPDESLQVIVGGHKTKKVKIVTGKTKTKFKTKFKTKEVIKKKVKTS